MAGTSGKVKTSVVDKNGKQTSVWKNPEGTENAVRSAIVPIAKAATKYSGYEIQQSPPIELQVDGQYDFTVEDGIDRDFDITRADIYRREDNEDGTPVYEVTGYGQWQDPKVWLAHYQFDISESDTDAQADFIRDNSDAIDRFMGREYDLTELEWNDDGEFVPKWVFEKNEPVSTDEAIDYWDASDSTKVYNESDPGTFGSRNMWADMAREIRAGQDVKELTDEEFFQELEPSKYSPDEYLLRALASDDRIKGDSGVQIVAQRALVSSRNAPWDAINEIARNTNDESVQLMAVETGKLPDNALATLRSSTQHESVRNSIDDANNKKILGGFGA